MIAFFFWILTDFPLGEFIPHILTCTNDQERPCCQHLLTNNLTCWIAPSVIWSDCQLRPRGLTNGNIWGERRETKVALLPLPLSRAGQSRLCPLELLPMISLLHVGGVQFRKSISTFEVMGKKLLPFGPKPSGEKVSSTSQRLKCGAALCLYSGG